MEYELGLGSTIDRLERSDTRVWSRYLHRKGRTHFDQTEESPTFHIHSRNGYERHRHLDDNPSRHRRGCLGWCLSTFRRIARQQVGHALLPQCYDQLWARRPVSGKPVANDGGVGGIERNATFRADYSIPVRHDPKGLAHRKPGTGTTPLIDLVSLQVRAV